LGNVALGVRELRSFVRRPPAGAAFRAAVRAFSGDFLTPLLPAGPAARSMARIRLALGTLHETTRPLETLQMLPRGLRHESAGCDNKLMPPRFAYWTILIDNTPTAFRARDAQELLPTLAQLKRTNENVVLKWFSGGTLWDSPEAAREARRRPKTT